MKQEQPKPPLVRVVLWAACCVVICAWTLPGHVRSLRPGPDEVSDFFQDWASVQYFSRGLSIYANQEEEVVRYLERPILKDSPRATFNEFNAHPPASLLLVLPFASLDYPTAQLVWTSLWLLTLPVVVWVVLRETAVTPRPYTLLIWLPLLTLCSPLQMEVFQGQLNRAILLLVVLAWACERNGRPWLAGALLGVAGSIKVLPVLLFLYFLCRRRWQALASGLLTALVLNCLAAAVFGFAAYQDYFSHVIPHVAERYRDHLMNASLVAFWTRLFDPVLGGAIPVVASHRLYVALSMLSRGAVVLAAAWVAWRARGTAARDHAFAACVAAALLVSPITWSPYFMLLLPGGVLLWRDLPASSWKRPLFLACLIYLWICDLLLLIILGRQSYLHVARPWESLTFLAHPTYALLGFFVLGVIESHRATARASAAEGSTKVAAEPQGTVVPQVGET